MKESEIVALIASFLGGFAMTWLRGYRWFNESMTNLVALAGGVGATYLIGAHGRLEWAFGIMTHTLTIFGAVHVGGNAAKLRAATSLPAGTLPQFNELSGGKQ